MFKANCPRFFAWLLVSKSTHWFFCNALACSTILQLTPVGAWVMSKLVLCCDINKFKIPTTKELSDSDCLFSYFQCQFRSWVGGINHEKCSCIERTLIKYQLLNIRRTLTLPILFYMNFHMWKINVKVYKSLVLVFNICGERRGGV
jgi:hypothetical protein